MKTAEQALLEVLNIVRQYLPPDGINVRDAMSEIIACVDPWPLVPTQPPAASQPTTRNPNAISLSLVMALNEATGSNEWQGDATASELLAPAIEAIRALAAVKGKK